MKGAGGAEGHREKGARSSPAVERRFAMMVRVKAIAGRAHNERT